MQRHNCELYQWCIANKFFYFQYDPEPDKQKELDATHPSHLCMDGAFGGKMYVAAHKNLDFLRLYAQEIDNGTYLYLSEQRTPVFRFYFDLDIKRKEYVPLPIVTANKTTSTVPEEKVPSFLEDMKDVSLNTMITQYCKDMLETIKMFYPAETDPKLFTMIICRRDNVLQSESPRVMSIGVHVIMPYLYVDANQALTMRGAAVGRFRHMYGAMEHVQNCWEDILDEQVYLGNGLRMVGSRKTASCPTCRNDKIKKLMCVTCSCSGKQDLGRVYTVWKILQHDGVHEDEELMQKMKRHTEFQMELTSVRLHNQVTTPNFKPYPNCPSVPTANNEKCMEIELNGKKVRRFKEDAQVLSKIKNKIFLPHDHEKFRIVEEYIRTMINPKYAELSVEHIFTNTKGQWYIVNVSGDASSFCMNVNRKHSSNKIYFLITADGIYQKCYSRKNELKGRKFGLCKDYTSKKYTLTQKLKSLFFKTPDSGTGKAVSTHETIVDMRNNTLKRSTVHSHVRSVDRAIDVLRQMLREKYETRHGTRQMPAQSSQTDPTSAASAYQPTGKKRKRTAEPRSIPKNQNAKSTTEPAAKKPRTTAPKKRALKPKVTPDPIPEQEDFSCP
jgi:hypothetical protein